MLVTGRKILDRANKENYAVGAFNINNMEILQAIANAASKLKAPVILQTSEGSIEYAGLDYLRNMVDAVPKNVEYALHLDHGKNLDLIKKCINHCYTSVMFDGSKLSFNKNIRKTRKVVSWAHKKNVSVEAELGTIGGSEDKIKSRNIVYTDPKQAKEFVEKTGIDSLAIAIGTSHGPNKFKDKPKLRLDTLKEIKAKTKLPLVLHGASEVPQELVGKLKRLGMKLDNTQGVPALQIKQAIKLGINKINTDTDLRLAFVYGLRKSLSNKEIDPRKLLKPAREEMQKVIEKRIILFGSRGKAR